MKKNDRHTILLGGLGGDSHSIGLTILRQGLLARDYHVRYLGTQNRLEDFFHLAVAVDVAMVSCMDGHSRHYLRDFPQLMRQYKARQALWYLGGNLHIGDAVGYERQFMEMGFHRVFVKFADILTVLRTLKRDLECIEPRGDYTSFWERLSRPFSHLAAPVTDEQLKAATLEAARHDTLEAWKTGWRARDLAENAEFLYRRPSFPRTQESVYGSRRSILIQPRCGVPLLNQQIEIFQSFKRVGALVLSYQVDSLTRNNNYIGAEEEIRESRRTGVPTLNGFPVVNHGVVALRKVIREINLPLQTRHSTRDPRLLAEISYAGGVTSFEGGAICYNIPYYKDYPLDQSVPVWQYVDRLTGLYYERFGIKLDREFFGTLTAALIPPSLAIAVNLLEMVLAVRQGVKCVSLGYAEQGHRVQDIAAIRAMRGMAETYIGNLGYKDVQINTVFHQYMAAFPQASERAAELIQNSATTAALSGATRVIIKTPVEAIHIPTVEDNIKGMSLAKRGVAASAFQLVDELRVAEECQLIRREVNAILDSVLICGRGGFAQGIVNAFRQGFLDIPFSPSVYNRGEVMTARDAEGAVRYLSTGQLQFERDLREFHREKMAERLRAEGFSERQRFLLIEKDVLQIPRGDYHCWPLFTGAPANIRLERRVGGGLIMP